MNYLNIGILAHVDAGKTSLTERLLFNAGVTLHLGSVDTGNTQTDSLALERQRGITIKSAVASFAIGDTTINLIDTPGHPDFIAEVERVLAVLDGVILVISAIEGVQPQTRTLMRSLQRLHIPTIIFINKTDRRGADVPRVLLEISKKLHVDTTVTPIFSGSAITGMGVAELTSALPRLLLSRHTNEINPPAGQVFKIERGAKHEKVVYIRLFSGRLHLRQSVRLGTHAAKITRIEVFKQGGAKNANEMLAGQIGKLYGLDHARIGDSFGGTQIESPHHFAIPTLETVITPRNPSDKTTLWSALEQLAEQDPLINLRRDDERQEISLSLYGEVQKEVIKETLLTDYRVDAEFHNSTTIYVERPTKSGEAFEDKPQSNGRYIEWDGMMNPFWAAIGLRVEPDPSVEGVAFAIASDIVGIMPTSFFTAIEESVLETLQQGIYGWKMTNCRVTLTHAKHYAPLSTAGEFRHLTPLVLMDALKQAGVVVCEPLSDFRLETPDSNLTAVLQTLAKLETTLHAVNQKDGNYVLDGTIPAAKVHLLQQKLPNITNGEGVLECEFKKYETVAGNYPTRERRGLNPLNRVEYLRRVT
jgi:ribosomal protection tetracycline resistance protein